MKDNPVNTLVNMLFDISDEAADSICDSMPGPVNDELREYIRQSTARAACRVLVEGVNKVMAERYEKK